MDEFGSLRTEKVMVGCDMDSDCFNGEKTRVVRRWSNQMIHMKISLRKSTQNASKMAQNRLKKVKQIGASDRCMLTESRTINNEPEKLVSVESGRKAC